MRDVSSIGFPWLLILSLSLVGGYLRVNTAAVVKAQTFGRATNSFYEPFGILGISPYVYGYPHYSFFLDSLKTQGLIRSRAFSLDLRSIDHPTGSVIFGGVDTSKYMGLLQKLPIIPPSQSPDQADRYGTHATHHTVTEG